MACLAHLPPLRTHLAIAPNGIEMIRWRARACVCEHWTIQAHTFHNEIKWNRKLGFCECFAGIYCCFTTGGIQSKKLANIFLLQQTCWRMDNERVECVQAISLCNLTASCFRSSLMDTRYWFDIVVCLRGIVEWQTQLDSRKNVKTNEKVSLFFSVLYSSLTSRMCVFSECDGIIKHWHEQTKHSFLDSSVLLLMRGAYKYTFHLTYSLKLIYFGCA